MRSVMSEADINRRTNNYIPKYLWDVITCPCHIPVSDITLLKWPLFILDLTVFTFSLKYSLGFWFNCRVEYNPQCGTVKKGLSPVSMDLLCFVLYGILIEAIYLDTKAIIVKYSTWRNVSPSCCKCGIHPRQHGRMFWCICCLAVNSPDRKVHGSNMGPFWGRQDSGGPHVGPMNFAIWEQRPPMHNTYVRLPWYILPDLLIAVDNSSINH